MSKYLFHLTGTPGSQTSSHHIPAIATITTNPTQIPLKPRPQFNKGDWARYKAILEERLKIPDKKHPTKDNLDNYRNNFDNEIKQTSETSIPFLRYRVVPGTRQDHSTRVLQIQLEAKIAQISTQQGTHEN